MNSNFPPGNNWLYFKFYMGPKTADEFLKICLPHLVHGLLSANIIESWFFIRYSDPHYHLRIRFRLKATEKSGLLVSRISEALLPWLADERIWKMQTDEYQRETERYGKQSMDVSEKIFFHDSEAILSFLRCIQTEEEESQRWLFGIRLQMGLMDDFGLEITAKEKLISELRQAYHSEFGMNRFLKQQLDQKYRKHREHIETVIKTSVPLFKKLSKIEQLRSGKIRPLAGHIFELQKKGKLEVLPENLLKNYIHMSLNRLFRTRPRLHELVIYDFLHRYLLSEIARMKYIPGNLK